jgi:hypothetical protein
VETRLKGYRYFEIERDFFNKIGVLIDGDFKFGVLLLVFVRFLGGDTGNLYRNVFFCKESMFSLLLYMKCNSRKINRPTENMTKIVTLVHF